MNPRAIARRGALLVLIVAMQFGLFEASLRTWGHSEATPAFQALFMPDPLTGYRLRPNTSTRFVTSEFDTRIHINAQGVRDDRDIGPKAPDERRIVVLGDSLVLAVQVNEQDTFCALLERRLNAEAHNGLRYRVINAGVQGYGPVEELKLYESLVRQFQPDLVIDGVFVGNDAEDAYANRNRVSSNAPAVEPVVPDTLRTRLRRVVRHSMVLQVVRLRLIDAMARLPTWSAPPEAPLQTYAQKPASRIAKGLQITADCVERIAADAAAAHARTMIMLIPARFQVDDADYGHLQEAVRQAGGVLVRDAGTTRFRAALAPLGLPQLDVLPPLRAALPGPDVFFQQTVHLTPRGHQIVAAALDTFIREHHLIDGF